jgi:hypothetical protein
MVCGAHPTGWRRGEAPGLSAWRNLVLNLPKTQKWQEVSDKRQVTSDKPEGGGAWIPAVAGMTRRLLVALQTFLLENCDPMNLRPVSL